MRTNNPARQHSGICNSCTADVGLGHSISEPVRREYSLSVHHKSRMLVHMHVVSSLAAHWTRFARVRVDMSCHAATKKIPPLVSGGFCFLDFFWSSDNGIILFDILDLVFMFWSFQYVLPLPVYITVHLLLYTSVNVILRDLIIDFLPLPYITSW
jgi:hypothetical protein